MDGKLQVDWFDGEMMPQHMADIMERVNNAEGESDTAAEREPTEEDDEYLSFLQHFQDNING